MEEDHFQSWAKLLKRCRNMLQLLIRRAISLVMAYKFLRIKSKIKNQVTMNQIKAIILFKGAKLKRIIENN